MHTNNDITTSNLTSVRRVPPLPSKGIPPSSLITSKQLERTTMPVHQPLTFTKKTSQVSLAQDMERRRSMENHARGAELADSVANMPLESHRVSNFKNNTCVEINITNDLLQILKDQNRNLKDQNNFLLGKIRQVNENQRALKQSVLQFEQIVNHLSDENRELKQENRELTEIAGRRVNEFGNKLAEFMTETGQSESQAAFRYRSAQPTFQQYQSTGSTNPYYGMLNSNSSAHHFPGSSIPSAKPKALHIRGDSSTEPNDSAMDQLSNQFQALIYSCRVEKNLQKRKHIRKQLVELTYRMRELKK